MTQQFEVRDQDGKLVEFGDTVTYPPYDWISGRFSHVSAWPGPDGKGRVVISGMEFYAAVWDLTILPHQPESD